MNVLQALVKTVQPVTMVPTLTPALADLDTRDMTVKQVKYGNF